MVLAQSTCGGALAPAETSGSRLFVPKACGASPFTSENKSMADRMRRRSGRPRRGRTVREVLQEAGRLLAEGQLLAAEALCAEVLAVHPEQPHALHLMGILSHRARRGAAAADFLRRAVAARPDFAAAWNALGAVLHEQRDLDGAEEALARAARIAPDQQAAWRTLAAVRRAKGDLTGAVEILRDACRRHPDDVSLARDLTDMLHAAGQAPAAFEVARTMVERLPDSGEARDLLAIELHRQGRLEAAVEEHRRAVVLAPELATARTNLGVTLQALGEIEEALACHEEACSLDATSVTAWRNRALALAELNRIEDAAAALRQALRLAPDDAGLHWDYSLVLLRAGRLREGWEEYEWRWQAPGFPSRLRHTDKPVWDGSDPRGRRLLVYTEQGLGDAIQFVRYLPLLGRRGVRVALECPPLLERLFRSLEGVETIATRELPPQAFDVQVPLLSLPRFFGTTLRSVPARVPYLQPPRDSMDKWAARIGKGSELRVGLVWAGSPTHRNDRNRSVPPSLLAPLLRVAGVRWFSLQVGRREDGPPPPGVIDLEKDLADFAETAAAVSHLDLVITVDTAVAHLAGALARPTWILLPFVPDWRWLLEREDSPWYPTARLFRQRRRGDWAEVVARVAAELRGLARDRDAPKVPGETG